MRRWRRFPFITACLLLILVVADFLIVMNQSEHVLAGDRPADERSFPFLNTGIVFRDGLQFATFIICFMACFAVLGIIEVYTVRRWHRTRSVAGVG